MPPTINYFIFFLTIPLFIVLASSAVYSDSFKKKHKTSKHQKAYQHRKSHNILPFQEILKKVRPVIHGEIIETEFEIEDGIPIYEFKYIDKNGFVLEMEVDARTGVIIKVERD